MSMQRVFVPGLWRRNRYYRGLQRSTEGQQMSKQKTIEKLCRDYQRKMQKLVDKNDGITGISIEVDGEKTVIAEKKRSKK